MADIRHWGLALSTILNHMVGDTAAYAPAPGPAAGWSRAAGSCFEPGKLSIKQGFSHNLLIYVACHGLGRVCDEAVACWHMGCDGKLMLNSRQPPVCGG